MTGRTQYTDNAPKQLYLPGAGFEQGLEEEDNDSTFTDPAFTWNKTRPVHRWVPWIAGFSGDFVREALQRYLSSNGTVLDPFCGVGTTLVEALLQGHNSIGFEVNPYAALASRIKTHARQYDPQALECQIARFKAFYERWVSSDYAPRSTPPKGFRTRAPFYSPEVLRKVLILQDFVATIEDGSLLELFKLAFASTMVRYSNYSYEPSLGRRVAAGKSEILDFAVADAVIGKLTEIREDITWLQAQARSEQSSARVINASFFDYRSYVGPASVDMIITSPPYLNNYHYNRNTRPQLYWLGYVEHPSDLKPLEEANFGKYWQTVRAGDVVKLEFSLPGSDLEGRLKALREVRPDKGIYGGKGWANYAASYFNDCHRFAAGINYTLKPGGTALVVIGSSVLQGILIPTDAYFGEIAELVGLELVDIHLPRPVRVGNSIIQSDVRVEKAEDDHRLYEAVVEIKKTG